MSEELENNVEEEKLIVVEEVPLAEGDPDEHEEEEEARLGESEEESEDDEDRQKKTRRKEERKTRRQRQKKAKERTAVEVEFLRKRNEDLERRFSEVESRVGHTQASTISHNIAQVKRDIRLADDVMAKAVEDHKGQAMVEAQGIRDNLRDKLHELTYAHKQLSTPAQPQREEVDPRITSQARKFVESHPWWDPNNGDEDSRIVTAIDNSLTGEGYNPTSQDYWDELADRVERRLPHHFESEELEPKSKRKKQGGPSFRTGGRERPLKKNEIYISPERKEALMEVGAWDDPVLRQKYLKNYAKYDKEHSSSN